MALRRTAQICASALPLILFGGAALASPPPPAPPISGVVRHLERPIAGVLVIFYNLGDTTLNRSRTAADGTFVLASAPVGVYDVIAYKRGFVPALVRLWHQGQPDGVSAVHIQLAAKAPIPAGPAGSENLWELRDRLPADVLREIVLEEDAGNRAAAKPGDNNMRLDRTLAGEVRTVANVGSADTTLSRTAVGVRGGLPNGWQYDLRGDYSAISENAVSSDATPNTGNVAGLALDVATSPEDHLALQTRRHTLSFRESPATFQTHGVSWRRDGEEGTAQWVAARYVEETNLYRATSSGTSFFPVASRTWEVKGHYERPPADNPGFAVAMTYRHREGMVGANGVGSDGAFLLSAPDADLSATASAKVTSHAQAEAGVIARYLGGGYGLAPVAGVRYDLGDHTAVFVRGLLRARESGTGNATAFPLVVSIDENSEAVSRKGFTMGIERRDAESLLRVEASNQRVSEAVRAFFEGDFLTEFDSVYLFDGNLVRQYRAVGTRKLSDKVSGTVSVRYGSIDSDIARESASGYGISSNKGRFWSARAGVEVLPTRTGVAVVVRGARQKLDTPAALRSNDSDKVAVSLAQDLSVVGITPFGAVWKLLVALESARTTTTTERDEVVATKRLLGGVAISF